MLIRLKGDGGLASAHGILKHDEVQVLMDAHQARLEAQEQCRALLVQAEQQAREHVADAHQQAMQFMQQAQEQAQQMVQMAQQSIQDTEARAYQEGQRRAAAEWHERHAQQLEQHAHAMAAINERLAGVVTMAVERLIAAQPRAAFFERALKQVQGLTRGAASLSVRVHPDDLEIASESLARLRQSGTLQVEVSADPALAPGGCVFESELGVLDASLDVQLEAMRGALERAARLASADAPAPEVEQAQYDEQGHDEPHDELHDELHEYHDDHDQHHEPDDPDADLDPPYAEAAQ